MNASIPSPSRPLLLISHLLSYLPLLGYTAREKAGMAHANKFTHEGMGYFHQQSTRPQTLGYGLADSPVGWLAWIYEKLVAWTDDYNWDDDEGGHAIFCPSALIYRCSHPLLIVVLTWISIYYFARAGPAASCQIYYEMVHSAPGHRMRNIDWGSSTTPLGLSYFPKEMVTLPRK